MDWGKKPWSREGVGPYDDVSKACVCRLEIAAARLALMCLASRVSG